MERTNLRLVSSRPVPVLREEYHQLGNRIRWYAAVLQVIAGAISFSLLAFAMAVLILSLGRP